MPVMPRAMVNRSPVCGSGINTSGGWDLASNVSVNLTSALPGLPMVVNEVTRLVVGSTPLLPHERKPAGFLRSVLVVTPRQTWLQNYLFEMLDIARDLSQY